MNEQKEQLATWIEPPLRRRLRVYAALRGLAITDVVGAALDGYLPPLTDMIRYPESGAVSPGRLNGAGAHHTETAPAR
jgi:hypothetical protein